MATGGQQLMAEQQVGGPAENYGVYNCHRWFCGRSSEWLPSLRHCRSDSDSGVLFP
jgi:hypothetical protein